MSRADTANNIRSRIAGTLQDASKTLEQPPDTLIAGTAALPQSRESGLLPELIGVTKAPANTPAETQSQTGNAAERGRHNEDAERDRLAGIERERLAAIERERLATDAERHAPPPKAWDKLSITLNAGDFTILETQTAQARAAGIAIRRGGNPSLFVRAAIRHFEALRLTSPAAWAEAVRNSRQQAHS
jgi:hypothetical protein